MDIDGIYSVVATSVAGSSLGVVTIRDGMLSGNDISGSQYEGKATLNADGSLSLSLEMTTPPGVFHVWAGTPGETFQTRHIDLTLPADSANNGKPFFAPEFKMWVTFTRAPEEFAELAGPDGRLIMIQNLQNADKAWRAKN